MGKEGIAFLRHLIHILIFTLERTFLGFLENSLLCSVYLLHNAMIKQAPYIPHNTSPVFSLFGVCVCQSAHTGSEVKKQVCTILRSLAARLEQDEQDLRSSEMRRDFIFNRLPPYHLQEEDLAPGVCVCVYNVY